jgi:outer membrane lipoprotein-sorting protein
VPVAVVAVAAPAPASTKADIAAVDAHLNAVQSMTANFTQTDARGRTARGTLQLKKPGRVRFEYAGGNLLLVADGRRLNFIDYSVGQKSSWGINETPLGLLLSNKASARGVGRIQNSNDPRVVVLRASQQPYGTLVLAFTRSPSAPGGLALYGWTAIDAQAKRTTVKLSNVRYNVAVPESAFSFREPKKRRG